ncbi:hypothetical protein [Flavobacterium hungaricum]|uniref:Uncharacterized protein n=1 Tax=Flavobacterium hungaricum TaxID=2082725 RepID=A0ABR9TIH5_9FLAO|nr:hypothetical protein [Flavobacterium hungaricum]MBE8725065.1 hypothetical protein [Flavobacterium hungaricum]
MEFNFNTFFGYEKEINTMQDQVLIYGFAIIIFSIVGLLFLAAILRKIGLTSFISFIINPLLLSLGLTLIIAILPTIVFYTSNSEVSSVKIIYSWLTIFIGMLWFVFFNLETIKGCFREFDKMSQQKAFRHRNK